MVVVVAGIIRIHSFVSLAGKNLGCMSGDAAFWVSDAGGGGWFFFPCALLFFLSFFFCSRTEEGAALDALDRNHTCACMNLALRLILAHHWIDVSPQHLRQPRCRRWAAESCLSSCPEYLAQCSSTVWHNIQ